MLTADTDLSVQISQINKLLINGYLKENNFIYWGSRSNTLSKVNATKIGFLIKFSNYYLKFFL